jgi:hypothetical protein
MSSQPYECPVAGCSNIRKSEHLMCWPHWRRVPRILQRGVWDTFNSLGRHTDAPDYFERHANYRKAAADAIAAVEEKERGKV